MGLGGIFLLSCVVLFFVHIEHTNQVEKVAKQHEQLRAYSEQLFHIELEVLHARLDNLNLTNYKINRFFEKFNDSVNLIKGITGYLIKFNLGINDFKDELILFNKNIDGYYRAVNRTVKIQSKMGFNSEQGILVDLKEDRANIENIFSKEDRLIDTVFLRNRFNKVLLLEKEFSRSLNMKKARLTLTLLNKILESIDELNSHHDVKNSLKNNILIYHGHFKSFMQMVIPLELSIAEGRLSFERLLPRLQAIRQNLDQRTQISLGELKEKETRAFFLTSVVLGFTFFILILFVLLQLYSTRSSNYRINQLNKALRTMSEGNYKISKDSLPYGQDEIGQLSETFYALSSQLQAKWTVITDEQAQLAAEKLRHQK